MVRIAPSLLATDYEDTKTFAEQLTQVRKADFLHVDVMDGFFVPNITLWNNASEVMRIPSALPKACHLMIRNPDERFLEYVHAGAEMISFHIEAVQDPEIILEQLHNWGVKAGLAINPETPLETLLPYAPLMDYILIMSVHPGLGGQTFIPESIERILRLTVAFPHAHIIVDGGVNLHNAQTLMRAGADTLVVGTALFSSADPAQTLQDFKKSE